MTIVVGDYWYSWCFMGYCMAIILRDIHLMP